MSSRPIREYLLGLVAAVRSPRNEPPIARASNHKAL
jgi:hypothetical protein